jgi:hypothetical protein
MWRADYKDTAPSGARKRRKILKVILTETRTMFTDPIHEAFRKATAAALKELFEKKHLYQSVVLDLSFVEKLLAAPKRQQRLLYRSNAPKPTTTVKPASNISPIEAELTKQFFGGVPDKRIVLWNNLPWHFTAWNEHLGEDGVYLVPPSISISCANCKSGPWPHNPSFNGAEEAFPGVFFGESKPLTQVHVFSYQCQQCKGEPLCFFVKRERFKFTIVGRSHFPRVEAPANFPESVANFYRKSVIASNTGFILASALYLRAAIEQHFRDAIPQAQLKTLGNRPTGDELGDFYSKILPKEFPSSCPSLKKAYSDLSEVIHAGKENDDAKGIFEKTRLAIETHFEALDLFKKISK